MKRFIAYILALGCVLCLASCAKKPAKIADGDYTVEVESSASMFRVVKSVLHVKDGEMTADLTMSGQGYGYLYMGKAAEAPASPDETNAIPFTLDADGAKVFTIPVSALDAGIDCAAWSIKKEQWYDRVLTFDSKSVKELKQLADGTYTCDVTLTGGSGRASIESPATLTIKDGKAVATIVWSSSHYEYMTIGETKYEPVQTEGNSTFELPISFDTDMEVSALTTAMSEPHLIDYTLRFDSSSLKSK